MKNKIEIEIDLTQVPDAELWSEINRRRAGLRKTFSGGVIWSKHSDTTRCRCVACNLKRAKRTTAAATKKAKKKQAKTQAAA